MTPEPSPEQRFVQKTVDAFIQWSPLGGSGFAFVHFLLQQDWMLAILTFPAMVVTSVWARYTSGFTARLGDIAHERSGKDADALAAGLDRLDRSLRSVLSRFDENYLCAQASACRPYVGDNEVPLPSGILNPDLDEVYVPLKLSSEFLRGCDGDAIPTLPGFSDKPDDIKQQIEERPTLKIWDFLAQSRATPQYSRLVILAYGGFGKTTLLRQVTYLYAARPRWVRRQYKAPALTPILLFLRKWRDEIAKPDAPSLPNLITQHHIPSLPGGQQLDVPPQWAKQLLLSGKALVMLDGFDEVADAQRQAVSHWITKQMQDYGKSVFILTSRPKAYGDDYQAERVGIPLAVQPFDGDQREQFIRQWYLCQERFHRGNRDTPDVRETATQRATQLLEQINQRKALRSMAENPLMLNMIAMFHRSYPAEQLPQRQTELYRGICKLQLGDRPMAKRVDLPLPADTSQIVLQGVALAMTKQKTTVINRNDLIEQIQSELQRLNETVSPQIFLEKIEQVSELMVKKDDGYEFSHRSFQEYLTAEELLRTHQEDLILSHFTDEFWQGTILMYVSLQRRPDALIQQACDLGADAIAFAYDCCKMNSRVSPSVIAQVNKRRYERLEGYLKAGQWKEADQETYELINQTLDRVWSLKGLRQFPCEDLLRLDHLWVTYSNGRFGFSVQKQIWLEVGGKLDYGEDWNAAEKAFELMSDRNGWRQSGSYISYPEDVIFDTSAPEGHLPLFLWRFMAVVNQYQVKLKRFVYRRY
ncbi:MAG TPA: GUN4 domain-containing protein [Candidatus Obscuribacterales bacterium]